MSEIDRSEEVLIALRRIVRAIAIQSKQLASQCGITTPQLLVLRLLKKEGELAIGGISKGVHLSQATVTAIVDRLERRGFVARQRSSTDRRRVMVAITDDGVDILKGAPSPIQESFTKSFSKLKEWEQTLVLSTLQRVADMMDATDLGAAPMLVEDPTL